MNTTATTKNPRAKILTRKQIGKFRVSHVDIEYLESIPESINIQTNHLCDSCSLKNAMYFIERVNDENHTGTIDVSLENPEGFYCSDCIDIFYKAYCAPNWAVDNSGANAFFQSYLFVYL